MRQLEGKTAIVTGTNRGLGKALVEKLAESGCDVWAMVRTCPEEFMQFLKNVSDRNGTVTEAVKADLTDETSIKTAYRQIASEKRSIDILINNAGVAHMGFFRMTKMEDIRKLYEVNLFAPMLLSQMVLRNMERQKNGKIINIASTAATEIYEGNSIYGASKSALIAFTQSLAAETARFGVTVNAIAPGLLDTDMSVCFEGSNPEEPLRHTAIGRKIEPEEIADVVVKLVSDESKIINGSVITINGGHK